MVFEFSPFVKSWIKCNWKIEIPLPGITICHYFDVIAFLLPASKGRAVEDCEKDVRFEVFTAVTMKNGVFWDVTPCGSCKNRRFGGT
jgi:hypothetical protein